MKLDERHLMQLAAVVQAGSVGEGAALLGLSQPAVSRTLSMLERRIGERLFERGRRPVVPTPLGRSLAEHGQIILAASRRASETVEGFRSGSAGVVRVGGTPFFMDGIIAGMVAGFQNDYPDVKIEQSYGYFDVLHAALKSDRIDLAICPIDVLEQGSGLHFREILPGRNVVACRATHPLLLKRKLAPSDLLNHSWIGPPPGSPLHADLRSILLSIGAPEVRIRYSGGSLASVINYMTATDALTILPHSVVFAFRKVRQISALPIKIDHPDRALGILRLADAPSSAAIDNFGNHISASFDEMRHLIKRHEQAVVWGA